MWRDESPRLSRPLSRAANRHGLRADVFPGSVDPKGERHYRAKPEKLTSAVTDLAAIQLPFTLHLGDFIAAISSHSPICCRSSNRSATRCTTSWEIMTTCFTKPRTASPSARSSTNRRRTPGPTSPCTMIDWSSKGTVGRSRATCRSGREMLSVAARPSPAPSPRCP